MSALLAAAIQARAADADSMPQFAGRAGLLRILHAIRLHLDMDVAFISEIVDGRRWFRHVDAKDPQSPVQVGGSGPKEASYCQRVIDGRLPELMPDACLNAEALTLAVTRQLPVGAHLSVPIQLSDGRIYGTFCCFSHLPNTTMNQRDLAMMRVLAGMVGEQIQLDIDQREARRVIEQRIDDVVGKAALQMVYQPIFSLATGRVIGFESLARFAPDPQRPPDVWFAEAANVGRAQALESLAIRLALQALPELPEDIYVAVNASPTMIVEGDLASQLQGHPWERIVLEITEHEAVENYEEIVRVIRPLQARGLRLAIDDAGAGYASFRHILNLRPEIVKLDVSITHAIDTDSSRRALAAALCGFSRETRCSIVAEGIETAAELATIRQLGIQNAQGYHLGRPMPLSEARALLT
jgi:EAL domain-containing protein (putative c-di-GMP-specific phosphodiesterase class I)